MRRVLLAIAVALVGVNIWTGDPALALWVGSRTQGGGAPTMTSVTVVTVVLAALSLAMVKLLMVLNAAYARASGRSHMVRAHTPWLRSMRGERPVYPGEQPRLTAPERVLVIVAVIAVLVFEYWFFFLSGSPIDQRSGRKDYAVTSGSISSLSVSTTLAA